MVRILIEQSVGPAFPALHPICIDCAHYKAYSQTEVGHTPPMLSDRLWYVVLLLAKNNT